MDLVRSDISRRKRRRLLIGAGAVVGMILVTGVFARLEPADPKVDVASIWTGTVKRGPMVREVRGHGTLVPEEIRWVTTESEGRIERIALLPGVTVTSDTVLLELSNPDLVQAAVDAESDVRIANAQLERLKAQLENEQLERELAVAKLQSELTLAEIEAEIDETLGRRDFIPETAVRRSRALANELAQRYQLELKRMEFFQKSASTQLLVREAELEKTRRRLELRREEVKALTVRAGISGVLHGLDDDEPPRVGQRINTGAPVARIADPTQLKAEIRIPERQAAEVIHGQEAVVDTRNTLIAGHVVRISPSVRNGTVTVDVKLDGPLSKGARPQLNVSCTITLERLEDVLYVDRPVRGQGGNRIGLFKVIDDGREAVRVPVRLGRTSVSVIEVEEGLDEGDEIVLSDMSAWDEYNRVRLN